MPSPPQHGHKMSPALDSLTLPRPATAATATTLSLLIEGWRGINHSYALANQHQILELLNHDGIRLTHRDLPFAFAHWTRAGNGAGFSNQDRARIDAIPEPGATPIDCVYRISSPIHAGAENDRRRTLTFMITELGLTPGNFELGDTTPDFFTRDNNAIVTSSHWSKDRIIDYGFPAEKIHVIPLGVDAAAFQPLNPAERAISRANLGIKDHETVFLNVGVAVWNKGIDILLRAFAALRARNRNVRLILKDQRDVYGFSVERMIQTVSLTCPDLLDADTIGAISVIPGNLDRAQLRLLYGLADCYVSPYRAEGFNLPVIEAIACNTPAVVTRGGATDDFCDDNVAIRIPGLPGTVNDPSAPAPGRYIEPDLPALIAAMEQFAAGHRLNPENFAATRARMLETFTWGRAAQDLVHLATGRTALAPRPEPAPRAVTQRDILDIIALLRPMAMKATAKVRIGNQYDGGYVVPETALACDGVISIGVGSDVSFDLELANRGAKIIQFDNTVEGPPVAHPNFSFFKLGWGTRTEGSFIDFANIHAHMDAIAMRRRLLKFDIEGGEYDALPTINPAHLAAYDIVACELHDLGRLADPAFYLLVRRALEHLTRHHVPIHVHANNYRSVVMVLGVPIPDVLEVSLLMRDLDSFSGVSPGAIPEPLDRPNHPYLPDICLRTF